jgi:hypothetical protein
MPCFSSLPTIISWAPAIPQKRPVTTAANAAQPQMRHPGISPSDVISAQ